MKNLGKILGMAMLVGLAAACKTPEWQSAAYNSVRWNDAETGVHAFYTAEPEEKPKADRYYAWFDKGRIGRSQGGYSGKLLHGKYTAWYYASRQLKEQGVYESGLKNGVWLLWEEDGRLKEKQNWNKGRQILPRPRVPILKRIKKVWPLKLTKKRGDTSLAKDTTKTKPGIKRNNQ